MTSRLPHPLVECTLGMDLFRFLAAISNPGIMALDADWTAERGSLGMPGHFLRELRATFAERADRPAIVYHGRSISYDELEARFTRCAAWLQGFGVEPGDRVAVCTPQKLPFL